MVTNKPKTDTLYRRALEFLAAGPALLLLHSNADLDCVGSALALQRAYPELTMVAPNGISGAGKRLAARLEAPPIAESFQGLSDISRVVSVDSGNPTQVTLPEGQIDLLVIDHHQSLAAWPATALVVNEPERKSCAEVVLALLERGDCEIDRTTALALLAGMMADTAHFRHADVHTLGEFTRLLKLHDMAPAEVFELLASDSQREISRRIAQLKGAQRVKVQRLGEQLIATSRTGSFESSTAHSLLAMGADVAFVASQKKRFVRLSGRCRSQMVDKGLNLGGLLYTLAAETGMEGGGHPGAAALSGNGEAEALLNLAGAATLSALKGLA